MSTSGNQHRSRVVDRLIRTHKANGLLDQNFDYEGRKLEILESWNSLCNHSRAILNKIDKYIKIDNIDFEQLATTVEELKENATRMGASRLVKACLTMQEFIMARNIDGCNSTFIEISKEYSAFICSFDDVLLNEIDSAPASENFDRFIIGRLGCLPKKNPGIGLITFVNNLILEGTFEEGFIYSEAQHVVWSSFFDDVKPMLKKFEKYLKKTVVNFRALAFIIEEIEFNAARIGGKKVVEACVNVEECIIAKDIRGCREAYEKFKFQFTRLCQSLCTIMFLGKFMK